MSIRLGINGFGRIGRLVYRLAIQQNAASGNGGGKPPSNSARIEIPGVNDIVPADNLAYLLQYDSTHRRFEYAVKADADGFECQGMKTRCTSIKDPAQLPWKELKVDYVLESTGLFTDYESSVKHIQAGAKRVIISAPTKSTDKVPTFAYKVNHEKYNAKSDQIISNASCTTNCLAPIAKVLNDNFGLEEGLMTTVHAVTATQPTQDGPSKKDWRGGRNGYANVIPASTGAAKAVTLCIPELKGKLTGMSFRVPVADVSCVDLTFRTAKSTNLEAINAAMKKAARGPMQGVLAYTDEEVVSSDFISDPHSAIFDASAGIELNDRFFKVVAWYDNEMGYAARCIDMVRVLAEKDGVK